MKDFLSAIATRGKPVADIEQGHISTACCILGNMALQLGRTLAWDAARQLDDGLKSDGRSMLPRRVG